jgi:predicted PurR-regulated permease PerM
VPERDPSAFLVNPDRADSPAPALTAPPASAAGVHPLVARLAAYSWRLLVIAAAVVALLWLLGRLRIVVLPLVVALFLARALRPVARWLERRRFRPALASATALLAFLGTLGLAGWLIGVATADEFRDIPEVLSSAIDDVERWLVEDSPFDISQGDVDRFRDDAGRAIGDTLRSNTGTVVSGAITAAEIIVGIILSLVITFFFVKDGRRYREAIVARLPEERRELADRISDRGWRTIGGYLRGAATLGAIEGVVIGITLALLGASLAAPMALLTFIAAFVPIVGAIVAGVLAVLVALTTASPTAALIVAAVALVVQQLDNDVLAPVVYGRAVELHPLVVLLSITAGGALFGFTGTFLAVPATALAVSALREAQRYRAERSPALGDTGVRVGS